ncbi:MAG: Rrf2 family transcriptional regulator [Holophagaceae bacterium]|nr:Rrf2 family transcriptional regulator [Holophagaceae bacterium]
MQGISRQSDYAVRTVLHLACNGADVTVSTGEISRERELPYAFVRQFVKKLVQGGILSTTRGNGGGIRLAKPASDISLLDVVQSTGGIRLNTCVDTPETCNQSHDCIVRCVWANATKMLENYLASVRFSDLANEMNLHSQKSNICSTIN